LIELKAEIAPCRLAIIEIKMAWSVGTAQNLEPSARLRKYFYLTRKDQKPRFQLLLEIF
jgi:hypothetical protein